MGITLTASLVPIPTGPSAQYLLSSAYSVGGNSPQTRKCPTGASTYLSSTINEDGTRIDIGSVFSPGFGIINGLVLSGSTLSVAVSAGQANIYGIAEYAGGTISIPDNTSHVYIWLKSDYSGGSGTNSLAYTTTITPPSTTGASGQCVYLGHYSTSAGVGTGPDTSGVIYLSKCGLPYRETYDAGMPNDTPGSGFQFLTRCRGGTYLWNGTEYLKEAHSGTYTASGNVSLTTTQTRVRTITASGGGGYTVTVPKEDREWIVRNPTAGSLAIYDGTVTITVATGKIALVGCDATSVFRITADATP